MSTVLFPAAAAAIGIMLTLLFPKIQKNIPQLHPAFLWVFAVLPVCFGGFFTWLSVPVSGLLLYYLLVEMHRKKQFKIYMNLSSAAVFLVCLGFLFTPMWAADKGMAVFGIVRYLPLVFYALLVMQMSESERLGAYNLIPLTGAGITAISFLLQFIPALSEHFTVNGRLSGSFQYPNTFALFLLIGFFIQGTKSSRRLWDIAVDLLLVFGIILSGSRAVFVLLAVTLLLLIIHRRSFKFTLFMIAIFALCLGGAFLISRFSPLHNSDRFTEITLTSSTFLGRLLYYKDALRVIIRNPFGLGYFGYRSLQGSFQTGNYSVAFVHNGFLQLLFEIGWIPALLLAAALLKTILAKNTPFQIRGILLITLAHCMFDFNMQYLVIWFLLITALSLTEGRSLTLKHAKTLTAALSIPLISVALWLGIGDFLYQMGNIEACLTVTPFHTDALIFSLTGESDPAVLDEKGDRILRLNPNASIAYSAKANAAFANGDIQSLITYKEQAIRFAKYAIDEYCDYANKLLTAYQLYMQMNDQASAQYCLAKLSEIEPMIEAVNRSTDPLADLLADDSTLTLPAEYSAALQSVLN